MIDLEGLVFNRNEGGSDPVGLDRVADEICSNCKSNQVDEGKCFSCGFELKNEEVANCEDI